MEKTENTADEVKHIRYIDNITILANVGEEVKLPNPILARTDSGEFVSVVVQWEKEEVDTSKEWELIFKGRVDGYVHDVLCSVQVGDRTDNPSSSFPHCLDQFGIPKRDIQTSDIPAIDDYQYLKAKVNRTLAEEYQLKELRELVADQVILAPDINHMRNAIIEIEKYIWLLQEQVDSLFNEVDNINDRINHIEDIMVIDGANIGDGIKIFKEKQNNILYFKTLQSEGKGITIKEDQSSITFEVEKQAGCGLHVEGKTFTTCHKNDTIPVKISDGMVQYSEYFNWQMIKIKNHNKDSPIKWYWSLLGFFGMGTHTPQKPSHGTNSGLYAGRFLKATNNLLFEIKTGRTEYSGFSIGRETDFYSGAQSRIGAELYENIDIYSDDVKAENRANRYGYNNEEEV